jgi:hypothetical protein
MSTSAKTASFWSPERGPRDQQDRRTSAVPLHAEGRTLTPNEPMPLHQTAASPHCGQRQRCREVQNRVVSFFPAWRAGAVFVHDSDLSNFFAESISVVPKPSVNRSKTGPRTCLASLLRPWVNLKRARLRAIRSSQNKAPTSRANSPAWSKQSSANETEPSTGCWRSTSPLMRSSSGTYHRSPSSR